MVVVRCCDTGLGREILDSSMKAGVTLAGQSRKTGMLRPTFLRQPMNSSEARLQLVFSLQVDNHVIVSFIHIRRDLCGSLRNYEKTEQSALAHSDTMRDPPKTVRLPAAHDPHSLAPPQAW